jgi:type IV pilus assembly protein PilM
MANNQRVLSIDITNESITVVEITASQKKQTNVHKVLIFETPEDSFEDGQIRNHEAIAGEIRTQLAQAGISNKNVIFVLNSTKIVNREVTIPQVPDKKIAGIINANASDYFPVNVEDYIVSHSVLEPITAEDGTKQLRVMAVAAPMTMVASYYDLATACGLRVVALDYIGNSMLQLIKTQTTAASTTMVIQLGSESTGLNIVQGDKLLLQRTVPYGTNPVVNVVAEERGVDGTTAMTMLQNDRIITVDFDDNEATGAFRYLINNIGRVMDYYSSKNPDNPIDDVFLTGDGALIRGIDGLFKIQLNVSTRVMDSLYNVKFDPGIDLKIYSPVYLIAPIGAAMNPMGFELKSAGGQAASSGSLAPFIAIVVAAALIAAGISFFFIHKKNQLQVEQADLQRQIADKEYIEQIIAQHDTAVARADDIENMTRSTYQLNENCLTLIKALEEKLPKNGYIKGFSANESSISIPSVATNYDEIADFIINLKSIDVVQDAYVSSIDYVADEETGTLYYEFEATCVYVDPYANVEEETEDDSLGE